MPQPQRVTIEEIVSAYKETGSVWKAAKALGIVGQSVWERLKAVGYEMSKRTWDAEELAELARLSEQCTISEIATRLGRPYYGVAIKLSRLGLGNRYGNRQKKKVPRGSGLNKDTIAKIVKELDHHDGSLKQFCRMKSLDLELLVRAIQNYEPDWWVRYSVSRNDLAEKTCPYCGISFHPLTAKQQFCTRKCSATKKRDDSYFGGNRRNTIGLAEGVCQLCLQKKERGLSSHHVLGKQHDPDNECLVALCAGCHHLVGTLASRKFTDLNQGWENLIQLVMGRRMADKNTPYAGVYVAVDMEYLTDEEVFDAAERGELTNEHAKPAVSA